MTQYAIHEDNMDRLAKKLTRIENKCNKFGCSFSYKQVGEEFRELQDQLGRKYTARFVLVEAEGTAVMNGWKFVASIEHTEAGNIIKAIGNVEVPARYYEGKPVCEHCNSNRYRKDTFVVMNEESGEFKQVGRSCLNDFTNGLSAEAVSSYLSYFDELLVGETPPDGGGERYYTTKKVLLSASETIRKFGYVKTQEAGRSTASRAFDYYVLLNDEFMIGDRKRRELKQEMESVSFDENSEENKKTVENALAWLKDQDESNNYMHNLKTICSLEYVKYGNLGILCSLFPTHNREILYAAERAEKARKLAEEQAGEVSSKFVGEIGERIIVPLSSIKLITSWETEWGITRLYKFMDDKGNVYTWKTGTLLDYEKEPKSIKGTVKEHTEYRGINQTELTRCKIA